MKWVVLLMGWPLIVVLLSPFLEAQHVFVQIAGLRNAVLFVPLMVLGSVLSKRDLIRFGSWAEGCAIGASCFAIGELFGGVESFFPVNEVTQVIYASNDITGGFLPDSRLVYVGACVRRNNGCADSTTSPGVWTSHVLHCWLTVTAIGLASSRRLRVGGKASCHPLLRSSNWITRATAT